MKHEVLYDEFKSMHKVIFVPGKRKYLFCTDQRGMEILNPVIEMAIKKNLSFELIFMGGNQEQEPPPTELSNWLNHQKMGSYLYMAGPWDKIKSIKRLAEEIGFSDEEMQYVGYGAQRMRVFCCRCHGITGIEIQERNQQVKKVQTEVTCCHCDLLLEVSDHYSSLRDAYLGYVAKL